MAAMTGNGGVPPTVAVARGLDATDGPRLLAEALAAAGARDVLAAVTPTAATPRPACTVVPTLSGPAAAAPDLVEDLVDRLAELGAGPVTVAVALTDADRRRGAVDAVAEARALGYRGRTPARTTYELVDLLGATVPAAVPDAAVIAHREVGRAWALADVRVVVARLCTDAADGVAAALSALPLVVPPLPGVDAADVGTDVLRHLRPQLAVVDARVSSHGPDGVHNERPLETATVVVATDALLADVACALLTGLDPAASRHLSRALAVVGLPQPHRMLGDLTPFTGWQSSPPVLRAAVRSSETAPRLAAVLDAATRDADPTGVAAVRATPDDRVLSAIRVLAAPLTSPSADADTSAAALAAVHATFAAAAQAARSWATVADKDRVERRDVPLGFDPAAYPESEYDAVVDYLQRYEDLLAGTAASSGGLRLRSWESSTLFEVERVLTAPYEQLVARVPLTHAIEIMADYLGGRRVVVSRDAAGRVVRQAERNLYLTQPNYLAFWGGEPIDVCKIEVLRYGDGWQRIWWRTVDSPNGSARHDDGSVLVERVDERRSRVVIRGRQEFTLPLFWQVVDLDLLPEVKAALVEDAYRRFFTATLDNVEAMYEGRDFRIGREPADRSEPPLTQAAEPLLAAAGRWLRDADLGGMRRPRRRARAGRSSSATVDEHGFTHVPGSRRATDRWELR